MKKSLGAQPLAQPAPVWVIGTYSETGVANAMTASWCGMCCSNPPMLGVGIQQNSLTMENVVAKRAFTVHVPTQSQMEIVDYLGIRTGRTEDKIAGARLRVQHAEQVDAPILDNFPVVCECVVLHEVPLGVHTYFIAEIVDIKADNNVIDEAKGALHITRLKPLCYAGKTNQYVGLGGVLGDAFSIGRDMAWK